MDEPKDPQLNWFHIDYSIVNEGVHFHIQEAWEYPGLRLHFTLDTKTGVRQTRFFIRNVRFDKLHDAVVYYCRHYKPRKIRIRL